MSNDEPYISQIDLISTIFEWMDRHGVKFLSPRQMNAIIRGVDLMLDEIKKPDAGVTDNMGITAWLKSDETGSSSRYMAWALTGLHCKPQDNTPWPHDPGDFGRCVGLLRARPELREHIPKMKKHGPQWAALASAWEELERLLEEEKPSGNAPKLYARMQQLLAQAK